MFSMLTMKSDMTKSYATRLEPELETRFEAALKITGLRAADLIRFGIRRVVSQVEKDGGLLVQAPPAKPSKRKGAAK